VDYLGFTKGEMAHNRKVIDFIKDADALVHVIRGFENQDVVHPMDKIDPIRDFETLETELIFSDLELVEKRLERIDEGIKKGRPYDKLEKQVLDKSKVSLEKELPLRYVDFTKEEMDVLTKMQFISCLNEVVVLNVGDDDLKSEKVQKWKAEIEKKIHAVSGKPTSLIILSGKIEMEIAQLSEEEAREFLKDLGIDEPAKNRLIKDSYRLLGYISFLTVGEDEVRAWTIRQGLSAQKAAGKVHSDIERGFIRAETVSYDDFMKAGNMNAAKLNGSLRLEGKTYIVQDGDIINFRFNV
jgi:hypothetical protein